MDILDVSVFTGEYDRWYASLDEYVEALLDAIAKDSTFKETFNLKDESPVLSTRKALQAAADRYNPTGIFLNLEAAIRMEFLAFRDKWNAILPT
jgi:regulator of protease activity HflC (stomatin/prohibitin superfamily)